MRHKPYYFVHEGVVHSVKENHMEAGIPWIVTVCQPSRVLFAERDQVVQDGVLTCLACLAKA
jgi:hypothetical protein